MAADFTVETIAHAYRTVHEDLRRAVTGLASDGLAWTPAPETNSVAVLVIHTLGSEAEVWHLAAGLTMARDRDSEFVSRPVDRDFLLRRLDDADQLLDRLMPTITLDDLRTTRERPGREPHTGLHWLITNYGHAREHLAHVQLTAQLYANRRG